MKGIFDEPQEGNRTSECEHERKSILDHRGCVPAPCRRLLDRGSGRGPSFGTSVIGRGLRAAESRCVRAVDQSVNGYDVLSRQPKLLILRPGDLRDDNTSTPADFDIGSTARRRRPMNEEALGRNVADADVEPAGILLQARGDQHLSAEMPPLVRLC